MALSRRISETSITKQREKGYGKGEREGGGVNLLMLLLLLFSQQRLSYLNGVQVP